MTDAIYIQVQELDYDDYPLGDGTKIGLFDSVESAEKWLEESPLFIKVTYGIPDFHTWRCTKRAGHHSVSIKNLLNTYMVKPEDFNELGY